MQVWINLIENAIKFTREGGQVNISLTESGSGYLVKITDSGIGMDKETISHIFDKFFQGDKSRSEKGNGLGLPLVKKILEISGAKLLVESEVGKATSICVALPAV